MTPEKYHLAHGDCFELLPEILGNKKADLILTDPPYGTTANGWDKELNFKKFWELLSNIAQSTTPVLVFGHQAFGAKLICTNLNEYAYKYIWVKNIKTNFLNAKKQPLRQHEEILVFYKQQPKYNPQKSKGAPYIRHKSSNNTTNYGNTGKHTTINNGGRLPTDVLYFDSAKKFDTTKKNITHPTQKPTDLLEFLIKTYTNKGDLVVDPFAGSASTGVAAVNCGRKFIGTELNKKYYFLAQNNLDVLTSQISMFS